jgi:hypothetical protein
MPRRTVRKTSRASVARRPARPQAASRTLRDRPSAGSGARFEEERREVGGEPMQPNVDRSVRDVDSAWLRGDDAQPAPTTRDPVVHERERRVGQEVHGNWDDDDDRYDLGGRGATYLGEGGAFMVEDEGGHAANRPADERYLERYQTEREPGLDEEGPPRAREGEVGAPIDADDELAQYDAASVDDEDWRVSETGERPEDPRSMRRMRKTEP